MWDTDCCLSRMITAHFIIFKDLSNAHFSEGKLVGLLCRYAHAPSSRNGAAVRVPPALGQDWGHSEQLSGSLSVRFQQLVGRLMIQ